jgi:hypothetical protein
VTARRDPTMLLELNRGTLVNSRGRRECEHAGPFPFAHKRQLSDAATGHATRSVCVFSD